MITDTQQLDCRLQLEQQNIRLCFTAPDSRCCLCGPLSYSADVSAILCQNSTVCCRVSVDVIPLRMGNATVRLLTEGLTEFSELSQKVSRCPSSAPCYVICKINMERFRAS